MADVTLLTDLVVLGADTDAGKTTFSLLLLAAFPDQWTYWKPVETGPSDSETVRRLLLFAEVHTPVLSLSEPVAPPLAAKRDGVPMPSADALIAARPAPTSRRLLIETFGGPFSPLTENELQIALIHKLAAPCVLTVSSKLGAIGRALSCLEALRTHGILPVAIMLVGDADPFAAQQIRRHSGVPVLELRPPKSWTTPSIISAAIEQRMAFDALAGCLRLKQPDDRWVERDRSAIWHPYSPLADPDPPLVVTGAQDEFLHLADGRRVIDAISSWWTILHGHRHPPLVKALQDAVAQIDHVHFAGTTHPYAIELAELMLQSMPWSGGRVFFSDNGSTAVEVALKLAYQFWVRRGEPRRTLFVGFEHGYHGDTFGAMSVGRDPVFFGDFEPLLFRALSVPLDPARLDAELQRHHGEVAAIIIEPHVQGAGGMRVHTAATLRAIFEVAKRHDVLFIADEVMTGLGRTGTLWAHQAAGIVPDLVCSAKTLAGGMMPLAATLVAPELAVAWENADRSRMFFHGHSFTAHPLACAVACANWKLLTPEFFALVRDIESFWREQFDRLRDRREVRDVRICGSIAAIEMDLPGGYLADIGRELRASCLESGVLLRPLGSVLYALPPLGISMESLERVAGAMRAAVSRLEREP